MAPTQRQWTLLEALWSWPDSTAREVTTNIGDKYDWTYNTVKTMLDRMVGQGLVTRAQLDARWRYRAAVERQALRRSAWRTFVDTAFGTGSEIDALSFAAHDLTPEEREALRDLLAELDD